MQVVINLSKKLFDRYRKTDHIKRCDIGEFEKALDRCTVIPKGYGRLIDADELKRRSEHCIETTDAFAELIENAPTIIPADERGEK